MQYMFRKRLEVQMPAMPCENMQSCMHKITQTRNSMLRPKERGASLRSEGLHGAFHSRPPPQRHGFHRVSHQTGESQEEIET